MIFIFFLFTEEALELWNILNPSPEPLTRQAFRVGLKVCGYSRSPGGETKLRVPGSELVATCRKPASGALWFLPGVTVTATAEHPGGLSYNFARIKASNCCQLIP